jgi:hypothetical protein
MSGGIAYKMLVRKPEGRRLLGRLGADGRIKAEWILRETVLEGVEGCI